MPPSSHIETKCVRACVHACVRACVRACVCVCVCVCGVGVRRREGSLLPHNLLRNRKMIHTFLTRSPFWRCITTLSSCQQDKYREITALAVFAHVVTFQAVFSRLADRTSAEVLVDHVNAWAARGAGVELTVVNVLLTELAPVPCRHKIRSQSLLLNYKHNSGGWMTRRTDPAAFSQTRQSDDILLMLCVWLSLSISDGLETGTWTEQLTHKDVAYKDFELKEEAGVWDVGQVVIGFNAKSTL